MNWPCASLRGFVAPYNETEAALVLMSIDGSRVPFHSVLAGRKRVHGYLHSCLIADNTRLARTHNAARGVPYNGITAGGRQDLRER